MSVAYDIARRGRVLAELGVIRWRLREAVSKPVPASAPMAMAGSIPFLTVCAPDCDSVPTTGVAARIWPQVLAWLGAHSDEVSWARHGSEAAIVLPPTASWASADGKRGIWLALKAHARRRG